jgi:hypothetical protein
MDPASGPAQSRTGTFTRTELTDTYDNWLLLASAVRNQLPPFTFTPRSMSGGMDAKNALGCRNRIVSRRLWQPL